MHAIHFDIVISSNYNLCIEIILGYLGLHSSVFVCIETTLLLFGIRSINVLRFTPPPRRRRRLGYYHGGEGRGAKDHCHCKGPPRDHPHRHRIPP